MRNTLEGNGERVIKNAGTGGKRFANGKPFKKQGNEMH